MDKIINIIIAYLAVRFGWDSGIDTPLKPLNPAPEAVPLPIAVSTTNTPEPVKIEVMPDPYVNTILPWTTQQNYFHNVRVLCDRSGLTLTQKNIICACIWVESQFRDRYANGSPVINQNKNKDGSVWSTDYGLVQVNDYYHIGPKKTFPSVAYVLSHPEATAQMMISEMKRRSNLPSWASYTSGVYKQYLLPNSAMWKLRT